MVVFRFQYKGACGYRCITIRSHPYTPPTAGGGCRATRQSLDFYEIRVMPRGRRSPRLGRATPGRDPHPGGAWLAAYAGTLAGAVQPVRPCGPARAPASGKAEPLHRQHHPAPLHGTIAPAAQPGRPPRHQRHAATDWAVLPVRVRPTAPPALAHLPGHPSRSHAAGEARSRPDAAPGAGERHALGLPLTGNDSQRPERSANKGTGAAPHGCPEVVTRSHTSAVAADAP